MKNYYDTLEVSKNASREVIEKAYRVLVKRYHPDLYMGESSIYYEKALTEINEAYNILSDDFLRAQYDKELSKSENEYYAVKGYEERIENNKRAKEQKQSIEKETLKEKKYDDKYQLGSFSGIINLLKEIIVNRPKRQEKKEITQNDLVAIGLTIGVVIILGIILWVIPFTNGWIRGFLFDNAVVNMFKNIGN